MSHQGQDLNKVLSRFDMLVLAFGAMIGWGWVVLSGQWILSAGSVGSLVAFAIGGLLVVFIGLTFAELASAIPKAGGELHFAMRAMGRSASFFTAWAIVLGYFSVSSFEAVALPTVIEYLFPDFKFGYLWTVSGWDVYFSWAMIGIIGAVGMTCLNYIGIRAAATLQVILTIVIALAGLMLAFGSFVGGDSANLTPLFHDNIKGIMAVLGAVAVPYGAALIAAGIYSSCRKTRRRERSVAELHKRVATTDCGKMAISPKGCAQNRAILRCRAWPWSDQGRRSAPCLTRFWAATRGRTERQQPLA